MIGRGSANYMTAGGTGGEGNQRGDKTCLGGRRRGCLLAPFLLGSLGGRSLLHEPLFFGRECLLGGRRLVLPPFLLVGLMALALLRRHHRNRGDGLASGATAATDLALIHPT